MLVFKPPMNSATVARHEYKVMNRILRATSAYTLCVAKDIKLPVGLLHNLVDAWGVFLIQIFLPATQPGEILYYIYISYRRNHYSANPSKVGNMQFR